MGAETDYRQLLSEMRRTRELLSERDAGLKDLRDRYETLEDSHNDLCKRIGRPGSDGYGGGGLERKDAITMCMDRHSWELQKTEGREVEYAPSSDEIASVIVAQRAFHKIIRHGRLERLDQSEQKSLSAFSFGGAGWVTPPEISSRILSCLTDETDFMSLLSQQNISGSSIQFPFDNSELEGANWACEDACVGPVANLPAPGMLEIKPESLRAVVCTTRDLLEDASFNIEGWIRGKAERAFRQKLAAAFIAGDGNGRPLGILNPKSGIPVCDTAGSTPPGTFGWQDLFLLKAQLPEEYQQRGVWLMNSETLALVLTMSDAMGRPIWMQFPSSDGRVGGGFQIAGSPVRVVSQMPSVQPGSTPILFADLQQLYLVITRRGLGMQVDPYSAGGWCVIHRFDARIGGSVVCANAGRLLRTQ